MSEVKRYGTYGRLVEATPQITKIYPGMDLYVLAPDYDALAAQRDEGLAREAELNSKLAALIKDRARFPDRPDFVGQMIGCSIGSLEKSAHSAEESLRWRHHQIEALQQRLAEASSIIREQEWQWKPYDDHYHRESGYYCPECGVERNTVHNTGCDIGSFVASPGCADGEKP